MNNNYELLGFSSNNIKVLLDKNNGHASTHFNRSPELKKLLVKSIPDLKLTESNHQVEYDYRRVVGITDLVETDVTDDVFYAKRLNRKIYSRFVNGRRPTKTSKITLALQKAGNNYLLISAWFGESIPPFPGDRREWKNSKIFWQTHALAYTNQEIDENTITKYCPW